MTNPFRKIAPFLLFRSAVFTILGLLLIARLLPALAIENVGAAFNVGAAIVGIGLLSAGVRDAVNGIKYLTPLRPDSISIAPIDAAYGAGGGGKAIPEGLIERDENPNEASHSLTVQWLVRLMPSLAFLPLPYIGVLSAMLVALGLGVGGVLVYVLLRTVLPTQLGTATVASLLDWYMTMYFLLGIVFWAGISRFGLRYALSFHSFVVPGRVIGIFISLLGASVIAAFALSAAGTDAPSPPPLGGFIALVLAGSLLTLGSAFGLVLLRAARSPERFAVYRDDEFVTVGMHPTDVINVIKSYTGRIGAGLTLHIGDWRPGFKEHTAVHAGEFEARLHAESAICYDENPARGSEAGLGTLLAWSGIVLTTLAGVLLWRASGQSFATVGDALATLQWPVATFVFGTLLYRLGIIPVAEMPWSSVLLACHIDGTFQAQGGMTLMNSGDQALKGNVMTSASVQLRSAQISSIGLLQPGRSKNAVVRLIDRVTPSPEIAAGVLERIREQAKRMHAGTNHGPAVAPALNVLPDNSTTTEDSGDVGNVVQLPRD
ncbi:MAG: hypothetical protein KDI09_11010 [Halioglobus sp.]|nr:hypothetical protein [Halioglobus sp.]